jgi:hypothetical protein
MILPKVRQIILKKIEELKECIISLEVKIATFDCPTYEALDFYRRTRLAIFNMQCDLKILKIQAKRLTKRMGDLK